LPERWIISRTQDVVRTVRDALDGFNFDVAAKELYKFFWHEFCDWYLELAKPGLSGKDMETMDASRATALYVLDVSLRLMHPFMPFVTEELWHHLPGKQGYIVTAPFPEPSDVLYDGDAVTRAETLKEIVSGIRNVRSEAGIHPGARINIVVLPHSDETSNIFKHHKTYICNLARVEDITIMSDADSKPSGALSLIMSDVEIFVPVEGLIDVRAELEKLDREEKKLQKELKRINGKLSNEGFLSKAPEEVVQKEREKQAKCNARLEKIAAHRNMLESL
jgi:valyl-tRNA synthetase